MRLHLTLLQRFLELPSTEISELRPLFDESGLEVKAVHSEGDQKILTIETLANRGDHLSALGIARELSARTLTQLKVPSVASTLSEKKTSIPVRKTTELCLRYGLLELSVPAHMPSRRDILQFLTTGGQRHGIIDLLNYVQIELGQPMHAFDKEKVEGEIVVTTAEEDEEIEALDGKQYRVPRGALVIRDKRRTIAVAGVIGCANSMVTPSTTRVLIESATFDPVSVRITARAMGLSTDASHMFERGTDTEQVVFALKRVLHLAQGALGSVRDVESCHALGFSLLEGGRAGRHKITLRFLNVRRQMNLPRLAEVEITTRLRYLGFGVEGVNDKECQVIVPTWRAWDISTEEDVVEEVARVFGYDRVKVEMPAVTAALPPRNELELVRDAVEPSLHGNGFYEVVTKGFYAEEEVAHLSSLDPSLGPRHLRVKNAVEKGNAAMKITNILHLAEIAERNSRHGVLSCKIYEFVRLFRAEKIDDSNYDHESDVLTFTCSGSFFEHEWSKQESIEDRLLLCKGMIEGIFKGLGVSVSTVASASPLLHPGFQAALRVGNTTCGVFGLLHPSLRDVRRYRQEIIYGELDASLLYRVRKTPGLVSPSNFPAVRRDITVLVKPRAPSSLVTHHIKGLKLENLRNASLIDQFRREGEEFRRLTYRLTFQRSDRTLEHDEVDLEVTRILETLSSKHGIHLAD